MAAGNGTPGYVKPDRYITCSIPTHVRPATRQQPADPGAARCAKHPQVTSLQVFGIQGFLDLCPLDLRSGPHEVHPFRLRGPTAFGRTSTLSTALVTSKLKRHLLSD